MVLKKEKAIHSEGEETPRGEGNDAESVYQLPVGSSLTPEDIAELTRAGTTPDIVQDAGKTFPEEDEADLEMEPQKSKSWWKGGKKAQEEERRRKIALARTRSLHLKPATVCMLNPKRGLELMERFEKNARRKAFIASFVGYTLVCALCGICSWITIVYGQLLFERVGTGAARGFLISWALAVVWDLGVMEWIAAFKKFAIKIAAASVITVLIGAYSLSNWYEDYSDFTTIDMMAGDDILDELTASMDDIESGD